MTRIGRSRLYVASHDLTITKDRRGEKPTDFLCEHDLTVQKLLASI
jgi:hypothetical protein